MNDNKKVPVYLSGVVFTVFLLSACGGGSGSSSSDNNNSGGDGSGHTSTAEPSPWNVQEEPTNSTLHGVHFIDADNGWVVGEEGTLLRTTDGGQTWSGSSQESPDRLYDVQFLDADNGWIAVDLFSSLRSALLHTTDGGDTWNEVFPGSSMTGPVLRSVHFLDLNTGWAFGDGGTIFHTVDGGETWEEQHNVNADISAGMFINEGFGWLAASNGYVYRYNVTNGFWGFLETGVTGPLNDLHFVDTTTGWAAGSDGVILRTTDSGLTWTRLDTGVDNALLSITFVDTQNGWATGTNGLILQTADGGQTWTEQDSTTTNTLRDVHFEDAEIGWAVGNHGTIVKHGGAYDADDDENGSGIGTGDDEPAIDGTWVDISLAQNTASAIESIHFFTDDHGVILVGGHETQFRPNSGSIMRTQDGGDSWNVIARMDFMEAMMFIDDNRGWAVGSQGRIKRTDDGGNNWQTQTVPLTDFDKPRLRDVHFVDRNNGWAVGTAHDNGQTSTVLRTQDGGDTWNLVTVPETMGLWTVHFRDANTGWIAGEAPPLGANAARIYYTTNGGQTWTSQFNDTPTHVRNLAFTSDTTGYAMVGGDTSYTLAVTSNAGQDWSAFTGEMLIDVQDMVFANSTVGWVVGMGISQTTDGGATWVRQTNPQSRSLQSLFVSGPGRAWAGGDSGAIIRFEPNDD